MITRKTLTLKKKTTGATPDTTRESVGGISPDREQASHLAGIVPERGSTGTTTREKASPPGRDQERQKATLKARKPQLQIPPTKIPPTTIKAQVLLARLVEDHPGLFPLEGPVTPWTIGIHKQIMTVYRVSKRVVGKALRMWLAKRGEEYREAVSRGEPRVGL